MWHGKMSKGCILRGTTTHRLLLPELFLEMLDFPFQQINFGFHFRKPAEEGVQALKFTERAHRNTPINFAAAHDFPGQDSGLGTDHNTLLYACMISESDLASYYGIVLNNRTSGDSGLGGNDHMFAHVYVVRNLNKVIYLGARPDSRGSQRSSVKGAVCADFDIVLYNHRPHLRKFPLPATVGNVSETVAPDDNSRMKNYPVSQLHTRIEHNARVQNAFFSQAAAFANENAGMQNTTGPDESVGIDHHERAKLYAFANLGARIDCSR
jgi:hypothetical protein